MYIDVYSIIFEADLVEILDKWADHFVIKARIRCDYRIGKLDSTHYTFGFFYGVNDIYKNYVLGKVSMYRHLAKVNRKLCHEFISNRNILFQNEDSSDSTNCIQEE